MKKSLCCLTAVVLLLFSVSFGLAEEKPAIGSSSMVTLEATVEAIDYDTRMVTLKGPQGKTVTFKADDRVKRLADIEPGDTVVANYYESVAIQVMNPDEATVGGEATEKTARVKEGMKPAGVDMTQITVTTVIEAIDQENQTVTLKGPQGNSKTVKVREPENLKKVAVGDKVVITYTEAIAIAVEEK